MEITSLQNSKIKYMVRLNNRRFRDREQKFLIEGYRALSRALLNNYPLEALFYCEELCQVGNEQALIEQWRKSGCEIISTSRAVFCKMAYRDTPEGLLGLAKQQHNELSIFDEQTRPPFYIIAEAIEKPGNLGTMLRTADATGVDGLILCDSCTDLFNPNVVRASIGSLFSVPIAEASSVDTLTWLRAKKIKVLAATPHSNTYYTDINMNEPLALVVGTEKYGLSEQWMQEADLQVKIPMLGQADSLNVATATALLLYEVVRQRNYR